MGRREKPLEPTAGPVQRFAYDLRKLRAEAGGPTYRALAGRTAYSAPTLSAAASGDRLPSLPVLLAYVEACGGDRAAWEARWHEILAAEPAPDEGGSPYPGLARFGPDDRDRFHGRDDLVAELLALTGRRRLTAVVGASGSGKSSLLRAGLIPALREGTSSAGGPRVAAIRVLTPGERPARTHGARFEPSDERGEGAGEAGDTLLVVDQFEEVFSQCHDTDERERFIGRVLAARAPGSRLRVVIAVRADFYGRLAEHGPLAEALRDATLLVGPLLPHRLREAIVRPAAAERLIVEKVLTARIVADTGEEPGGLPLMAHALREVWRRRSGKTLTLAAYEAIGGVQGAVAHTAEEAFGHFTQAEAARARALLLRMVAPGDGTQDTRRTVERSELGADCGAVLERLVAARLLTVDGTRVDLAHEALISAWPRLRRWIETDRERLRLHRALTEAALSWRDLDRDPGALYRGTRLSTAREAFADATELTALEGEFLAASRAAHDHGVRAKARAARRSRALLAALAVLVCLAAVAGALAWQQNRVSDRRAAEAQARRIASIAQTLRVSDPRTSMRLGVAAWRIADLPETREAVRTAGTQREVATVAGFEAGDAPNAPSFLSEDGRVLTVVDRDEVTWWDARGGRRLGTDTYPDVFRRYAAASPDGRFIALRTERGYVVRDVRAGRTVTPPFGPRLLGDMDGEFAASGRLFVVRGREHARVVVQVWDVRRHKRLARVTGDVASDNPFPLLSPDGRRLLTCARDGRHLTLHAIGESRSRRLAWPDAVQRRACSAESWTFTPDSRALSFAAQGGVRTWEVDSARERPPLDVPDVAEWEVDYDQDGGLAVTSGPGELALWRTASPGTPVMRYVPAEDVYGVARLDRADGVIRYQADDAVVRAVDVRDVLTGKVTGSGVGASAGATSGVSSGSGYGREQLFTQAEFSPDSRTLAVVRRDRAGQSVELRDARDGRVRARLPGRACPDCPAPLLRFSPSGKTLVSATFVKDTRGDPLGTRVLRWSADARRPPTGRVVPSTVDSLTVPGDGSPAVTSGSPAEIRDNDAWGLDVWKVGTRAPSRTLRQHTGGRWSRISPDGLLVLSSNGKLTDVTTGHSTRVLRGEGSLENAAFSPDGRYLAVVDAKARLTLWNARGTQRLGALAAKSHGSAQGESMPLAFSPDSRLIAMGREDGGVRVWETDTPRLTGAEYPAADGPVLALGFAGDVLRVATPRTPVREVPLAAGRAAAVACRRAGGGLTRAQWRTYLPNLPFRSTC
ncbi:PD40 domain-containing protein [Streptomyces sp. MNP-20]|uniref:nSTAND1 domain-containing NTPase n=1 Tax=Streptomyces sp. MNP-20 TaxID=2721165 RepID=UPI0015578424|nr:PD40 domain-containing protein [Streptomyces sp. MNP-20]